MIDTCRVTWRCTRSGSANHVSRDFDTTKAQHIDQSRIADDVIVSYCPTAPTQKDAEIEWYRNRYQPTIDAINANYVSHHKKYKCTDAVKMYNSDKYRPEELILQIGDRNTTVTHDTAVQAMSDMVNYIRDYSTAHGNHIHVLDYGLHAEEASYHMHVRVVYDYQDDKGLYRINQNKALELSGIDLPHPDAAPDRYNNRKIAYDTMMRGKWQDIVQSYDYDVIREPIPDRKHRDTEDYIRSKIDTDFKSKKNQLSEIIDDITYYDDYMHEVQQDILKLEQIKQKKQTEIEKSDANIEKRIIDIERLGDWLTKASKTSNAYKNRADVLKKYMDKTEQLAVDSGNLDMQEQINMMRDLHTQAVNILASLGKNPEKQIQEQIQEQIDR